MLSTNLKSNSTKAKQVRKITEGHHRKQHPSNSHTCAGYKSYPPEENYLRSERRPVEQRKHYSGMRCTNVQYKNYPCEMSHPLYTDRQKANIQ